MRKFFDNIDDYLAYLEQGAKRWEELKEYKQAEFVRNMIARVKREN
jgi:hypothetical protein